MMAKTTKKINQSCNKPELSFNFIAPACQKKQKKRIGATLCKVWFLYSPLWIPGVVLPVYSLFQLTSDCDHAFRPNLASSLHLLPLPIRSDTGRWLSSPHLVSVLSGLTSPPQTASLTLPVKTSANCCHSSPALSHHSGPNEEKADTERVRNRDVYVIWVSPQ